MPARPCRLGAPSYFERHPDVINSLAFGRDGKRLLLASSDQIGDVYLWDVSEVAETGAVQAVSKLHFNFFVNRLAFSPTDPLLVVGGDEGKIRVVSNPRSPTQEAVTPKVGYEYQPVQALAFSPDGDTLATGGLDEHVVLWDVVRGRDDQLTLRSTAGNLYQANAILSLAFSPDGQTLAAGDGDGATCLYDVESRRHLGYCLLGHSTTARSPTNNREAFSTGYLGSGIRSVTFIHGGRTLLTAGDGSPVVAWDSTLWSQGHDEHTERLLNAAVCGLAGRNLTADEWGAVFRNTKLADDRHNTCPSTRC